MREIGCEVKGENLVIHLPEELDHHSSRSLGRVTEKFMEGKRIRRLVFDYSRTRFMDSAGVGAVLSHYKVMKERQGEVRIYGVSKRVRRLLEMAGIHRLARICQDEETALGREDDREDKMSGNAAEVE